MRLLGTDNPRKEDLKFVALTPDSSGAPTWKFPNVFNLSDPLGYYQQICVPRQTRAIQRYLHQQIHRPPPRPTRAGGGSEEPPGDNKAGGPKGTPKGGKEGRKGDSSTSQPSAYPAGKRLAAWEATRSVQHAPTNAKGKPLCWDNSCWIGCRRSAAECSHSHETIKGLKNLDWTVVAQILKRGGLRSGPKVEPTSVDGRIAQLRAQAKAEGQAKR